MDYKMIWMKHKMKIIAGVFMLAVMVLNNLFM